ncbi:MAG: glycine cleavage system protein GcvH [Thermodesulfobacteriota bacterium]
MVDIPDDLKYTEEHEWVRIDSDWVEIGITDYAQEALGEIVFVELPGEGDEITKGDSFGGVESTKSVSDLYSPVSGEVIEVNDALLDSPETINEDSYGSGWIIRVRLHDSNELDDLLSAESYANFIENEMDE